MESTTALALALFGRRRWRWRPRALSVLRLLAGGYLVALAALLAATLVPLAVGWRPYLITSGSMEPDVPSGSLVLADRDGTLDVSAGDVVVVHDPARPGSLLTHRVVGMRSDDSVVTKGDANPAADALPVPARAVVGRVRAILPLLGMVVRHRVGYALLTLLAGLLVATTRPARRARRLPRALVATTAAAALTSALTWQATGARIGSPPNGTNGSPAAHSAPQPEGPAPVPVSASRARERDGSARPRARARSSRPRAGSGW